MQSQQIQQSTINCIMWPQSQVLNLHLQYSYNYYIYTNGQWPPNLKLNFTRERIHMQSYIASYGYRMCRILEWCPTYLKHLPESLSVAETTPNLPASSLHVWHFGASLAFKLLICMLSLGSAAVDNSVAVTPFSWTDAFLHVACKTHTLWPVCTDTLAAITHEFWVTIWENRTIHDHTCCRK